jgi:basic membrane protein A
MKKTLLSLFALAAMSATALAADVKPALVYGTGGKFDKSFNEAAYGGAEKFKAETGIDYRDFEPTSDTQGEQAASTRLLPSRSPGPRPSKRSLPNSRIRSS